MLVTPETYTVNTGFAVIFFKKLNHRNEANLYTVQTDFIRFPPSGFH